VKQPLTTAEERAPLPESTQWCWSDAWFLESVAAPDGGGGVTLPDALSVGDYINHAVFNRHEVEDAANRLAGAGLLRVVDDRFETTEAGLELRRGVQARAMLDRVTELGRLLEAQPVEEPDERWTLTEADYARATAEYAQTFAREIPDDPAAGSAASGRGR
jgi:hypothetical protein